ncbi:dihydrofolate reductase family protein [Amycolatopsis sp. FDAARGOS 1241]|uniref:dihydrofolate reductase family protein n=1 Tax=Amycolatopsis sp. FDAARGOS 1241 TaxID=2778070 RepID=UPI00194DC725|nr:dihydrofolate reductase family protein [Amycolatopsis sp. FDAARGOS 1241]QRP43779.1 dihydrofolate reductase family protein [Amycolatopsis sp. FDAARGOS 1241]
MSKVICAHAVSVDGFISGRTPDSQEEFGRGLGDAPMLFDWYFSGDTPSRVFDGFKLSEPSARLFDDFAARIGAVVAGRATYEHSSGFGSGSPHPTAPLFVVSHRPVTDLAGPQTHVTTGVADAVAAARAVAGGKDVGVMGGALATEALKEGLVDELVLHQVPVLLGGGRRFFHELPDHVRLRLRQAVAAPGVTHLHYEVLR